MPSHGGGHGALADGSSADGSIWILNTRGRVRDRDAAKDAVRLIGKSRGVEERSKGLVGVTVPKYQRSQSRDDLRPAIIDR
jgi:hypothetical protein